LENGEVSTKDIITVRILELEDPTKIILKKLLDKIHTPLIDGEKEKSVSKELNKY